MPVNGVRCRQSRWSCHRERCLIVRDRQQSSALILSRAKHGPSLCPAKNLEFFRTHGPFGRPVSIWRSPTSSTEISEHRAHLAGVSLCAHS